MQTMRSGVVARALSFTGLAALALCVTACSPNKPANPQAAAAAQAAQQEKRAEIRAEEAYSQELDQIPPPSKNLYMTVRRLSGWDNPFLIIGAHTVNLRVPATAPSAGNPAPSGILRPQKTRWRKLQLQLADLPEALAALPEESWPYGRVIAVEDDPTAPRKERVQVRRNEEATLKVLNDMGVVVYEWPGNGAGI